MHTFRAASQFVNHQQCGRSASSDPEDSGTFFDTFSAIAVSIRPVLSKDVLIAARSDSVSDVSEIAGAESAVRASAVSEARRDPAADSDFGDVLGALAILDVFLPFAFFFLFSF